MNSCLSSSVATDHGLWPDLFLVCTFTISLKLVCPWELLLYFLEDLLNSIHGEDCISEQVKMQYICQLRKHKLNRYISVVWRVKFEQTVQKLFKTYMTVTLIFCFLCISYKIICLFVHRTIFYSRPCPQALLAPLINIRMCLACMSRRLCPCIHSEIRKHSSCKPQTWPGLGWE